MSAGYRCKECGIAVIVKKGKIIRGCKHTGTIVTDMSAVATGVSSLENKKLKAK